MVGPLVLSCFVSALLVVAGIGNIEVARRTADGRIGPNRSAGIRTRTTRASEQAWTAAHQAAQRPLVIGGWLLAVTGGVALVVGGLAWLLAADGADEAGSYMSGWTAVLLVGVAAATVVLVWGAVVAQRAAKAVVDGDPVGN